MIGICNNMYHVMKLYATYVSYIFLEGSQHRRNDARSRPFHIATLVAAVVADVAISPDRSHVAADIGKGVYEQNVANLK
jgi:hypothetical protein